MLHSLTEACLSRDCDIFENWLIFYRGTTLKTKTITLLELPSDLYENGGQPTQLFGSPRSANNEQYCVYIAPSASVERNIHERRVICRSRDLAATRQNHPSRRPLHVRFQWRKQNAQPRYVEFLLDYKIVIR